MNDDTIQITWNDTKFQEDGKILEKTETDILFESKYDGTINWIPLKHIVLEESE